MKAALFILWTASAATPATVRVVVTNQAGLPGPVLSQAIEVANRILEPAVVTVWDTPTDTPAKAASIYVRILPSRNAAPVASDGSCAKANPAGSMVWVPVACAEKMAGHRADLLPATLGHLIAHEIGHILLADHSHDRHGLMRANWGRTEINALARGTLHFADPSRVRDRAEAWVAEKSGIVKPR